MEKCGSCNTASCNIFTKYLLGNSDMDGAISVWEFLKANGISADSTSYGVIIDVLYRNRCMDKAIYTAIECGRSSLSSYKSSNLNFGLIDSQLK